MIDGQGIPGARLRAATGPAARDGRGPPPSRDGVRVLLRGRRDAARRPPAAGPEVAGKPEYFRRATCASFQMDGVPLTPEEFDGAMSRLKAARACRTRGALRARNHVAILVRIETMLRRGQALQAAEVVRWYTSIACGLSAGGIAAGALGRLDRVVTAVNSPRLRFWPAVQEVAALHVGLLDDPFVPGFNGILARLLLRFHMGRCGLPPVVFDPEADPPRVTSVSKLEPRLLELIAQGYDGNGQT